MSFWEIYVLTILPGFIEPLGVIAFFSGMISLFLISGVLASIMGELSVDKEKNAMLGKMLRKWAYVTLPLCIFSMFSAKMIPSEKQMAFIVGGYMLTNIQGIKDLPPNLVKAMNTALDEYNVKSEKKEK